MPATARLWSSSWLRPHTMTDEHADRGVARAKPALDQEGRDEQRGTNHARRCSQPAHRVTRVRRRTGRDISTGPASPMATDDGDASPRAVVRPQPLHRTPTGLRHRALQPGRCVSSCAQPPFSGAAGASPVDPNLARSSGATEGCGESDEGGGPSRFCSMGHPVDRRARTRAQDDAQQVCGEHAVRRWLRRRGGQRSARAPATSSWSSASVRAS